MVQLPYFCTQWLSSDSMIGLKRLDALFQPVRSKAKTNRDSDAHRRTGTFGLGGGGGGDFLARKNFAMPESVRVEIGMQTQTSTISASNETAIIGKIIKLKACVIL